jgi:hypothetical protein
MSIVATGRVLPAPSQAERKVTSASKGHCIGFAVLGRGAGVRMQAESHLELNHLYLLNADPAIADLREQVRFRYGPGDAREHFFDAVYTTHSGRTIACTIKPERRLASGRFLTEMQTVVWWVRKKAFADDLRLLTDADLDPVALHNARIVAAVRDSDPEADAAAREAAGKILGAVALCNLVAATRLEASGYRALLRLLRDGALSLLRHEPITPAALVKPTGAN